MSDDFIMRVQLQRVAVYRDLCKSVRRSGRWNVVFALIMLGLAYMAFEANFRGPIIAVFAVLAFGELLVGLYKWLAPSAEGFILDGVVLLAFVVFNLGQQYLRFQAGAPLDPVSLLITFFILTNALNRFKEYSHFRRLFAERPSAEHIAWFDELVREIRHSHPESDELALDLPTSPHWKAKLLGTTVFFVAMPLNSVVIVGPDDFQLLREKADRGTGRRRAQLQIHGVPQAPFEITDATWANYQRWRAANPYPG